MTRGSLRRALASGLALFFAIGIAGCGAMKRCAYAGPGRDDWQQPQRVIEALALAPGQHVADLGAGGGYFTFRLADAVGPSGRVFAVDVDPDMIEYLRERAAKESRREIEVVLAATDDARLPPGDVDLVLVSDTYHHLTDRVAYFARLRASLRPGGRVAVLELLPEGFFQGTLGHGTKPEDIRREMEAAGYRLTAQHDFLAKQSFQVFTAVPDA